MAKKKADLGPIGEKKQKFRGQFTKNILPHMETNDFHHGVTKMLT
jgi:hypothetical protein